MADFLKVVIGIQARSTSHRFPRKVFQKIGEKMMISHVLEACERSARYMNGQMGQNKTVTEVALLVPYKDELVGALYRRRGLSIIEGPEDDVLARYVMAARKLEADYIVRVTGDCPLIPPYLITKHVTTARMNGYDYLSNVDDTARTAADGTDCEVISRKLLEWLDVNATDKADREHVTTLARRAPPEWASTGHVIGHLNLSGLKLSVDTEEDLERVRGEYEKLQNAIHSAEAKNGKQSVHRF